MRHLAVTVLAWVAVVAAGSANAAVSPAACPPDVSGARCGTVAVALDPADPAAGTLEVRFELYRHDDRAEPPAGTIVAVEGGPGYATTASRDGYLELFRPLYGDSYGTFFSQAFAVRHPDRLDTLILDAPYPVEGQDPWYRDAAHAVRDGFRLVCERGPSRSTRKGSTWPSPATTTRSSGTSTRPSPGATAGTRRP